MSAAPEPPRSGPPGPPPSGAPEPPPSVQALRRAFDNASPYTVGLEDEVMLLDGASFELAPRAQEVLERLSGDERFKLELPSSQVEIVTPEVADVSDASRLLLEARTRLAERTEGLVRPAAAGVHPFSSGSGELNCLERYGHTIRELGPVAARQLVCALQVHVTVGDADRALAVYNAARSYLPLLAAVAANAPFYEGRDTRLASVRPKLCELLPRQGVPPPIESWEEFADDLQWGAVTDSFQPGAWWWELRPHRRFGTLEFRVPDGQSTVADAAALAALAQSLVAWLADRHAAGEYQEPAPTWRIAENRWSACHHGVEGRMADVHTGAVLPTRMWLEELIGKLEPVAARLGCSSHLAHARELVEVNGAILQRQVVAREGMTGLGRWLAERFLEPLSG